MQGEGQPLPAEQVNVAGTAIEARIAELRPALKGYVLSLLPQSDVCDDVVQETCLFLWEKRDEFPEIRDFKAWAFKTAWFKALSARRDLQRRKYVTLSEDVLQRIAGAAEEQAAGTDHRIEDLRQCLASLPEKDLELLRLKYSRGLSLAVHARQLGWQPNRLQKAISRLRLVLRHCIETRISNRS